MKKPSKTVDYSSVIKYAFLFFCFLIFARLESSILPYSGAIFVSALTCGASIIPCFLLYLLSFLCLGAVGLLGSQAIFAIIMAIITLIYRNTTTKINLGFAIFSVISMLSFIFLGDTAVFFSIEKRILTALLTGVLSFFSIIASNTIINKGLKFKLDYEEYLSIAILLALFGTGACNLISPYFWRAICAFLILTLCYLYKTGTSTLVSCILGVSFSLYYSDIIFVSVFLILSVVAECLSHLSRYLSAIGIIMADYLIQLIFGVYGAYTTVDFLSILVGAVLFCVIPERILSTVKERLYSFREKHLIRQTINRCRQKISNRLYECSTVFSEMASAFENFKKQAMNEENAKKIIQKQISSSVCAECEHRIRCKRHERSVTVGLSKMLDIGFAKGKLSLIDFSKEFSSVCLRPNDILFCTNKLLADFRAYAVENANHNSGRELIASQANGVAEVLCSLALETGTQLKYQNRLERTLCNNLFKSGFIVNEVLIYGEDERLTVNLIVLTKSIPLQAMQKIVSDTVGSLMIISERTDILEDKCFLSFKMATDYDVVYGIARAIKDGSDASGDTHSVTRIEGDRLLVALSDGMGSGQDAKNVSSTALSLIESFYKAGLSSKTILNTVNKLLSINTEDSFTALDLCVLDLKTCSADFIKYGSPYGFIVSSEGIKIVEGNSLPLGIIDELKPSVCSATLNDGDVILLLSDGISDAFSSTGEIIDYLRTLPAKNPQSLADQILETAISKNLNQKKDDMTALAVRIFKRKSA